MSDVPPILEPVTHQRHWLEYVATATALVISAVSLWVAVGSMDANKKMVAAASWPFLQVTTSDATEDGKNELTFDVGNAGVGPALVEYFEVTLDGKPIASSKELLQRCCGFDPSKPRPVFVHQPNIGSWTQGTVGGSVIRAGENRRFFSYPQTPENLKAWTILRDAVSSRRLLARACYCSVFEECWQGAFIGLHPKRVDRCIAPKVIYQQ
ncbi:MAG TPA: hypothetical protein VHL34_09170 [Rhizomicrobium sp.]|jgi:hypothetical protein|nr:hypothetical protein [Rhizomicrobium sp.]